MSRIFIGKPPVDGRNHPAQRRRAVATIKQNIESPAYSHGGDQSAGFYGCGIQQVTRLRRVLLNSGKRDNTDSGDGVNIPHADDRHGGKGGSCGRKIGGNGAILAIFPDEAHEATGIRVMLLPIFSLRQPDSASVTSVFSMAGRKAAGHESVGESK